MAKLPWELAAVVSVLRCAAETAALLGSLTLGVQLIVLGASLLPPKAAPAPGAASLTPSSSSAGARSFTFPPFVLHLHNQLNACQLPFTPVNALHREIGPAPLCTETNRAEFRRN